MRAAELVQKFTFKESLKSFKTLRMYLSLLVALALVVPAPLQAQTETTKANGSIAGQSSEDMLLFLPLIMTDSTDTANTGHITVITENITGTQKIDGATFYLSTKGEAVGTIVTTGVVFCAPDTESVVNCPETKILTTTITTDDGVTTPVDVGTGKVCKDPATGVDVTIVAVRTQDKSKFPLPGKGRPAIENQHVFANQEVFINGVDADGHPFNLRGVGTGVQPTSDTSVVNIENPTGITVAEVQNIIGAAVAVPNTIFKLAVKGPVVGLGPDQDLTATALISQVLVSEIPGPIAQSACRVFQGGA